MPIADASRLIILAAIWGGSFVFLRVLSPVLGPLLTADLRVLIAWMALAVYFRIVGQAMDWRRFWVQYLIIGFFNAALPFSLFAFAALYVPASYSAIINATSPIFGALFSVLWLGEKLTANKLLGFIFGIVGVALVTKFAGSHLGTMELRAMAACLGAALCYGFVSVYTKKFASAANPTAVAGASQLMAGLVLIPWLPFQPPSRAITLLVAVNMLAFALLCSGVAFLLYFRLIANVGPTKALTVTFLMPAFTMLWARLFIGETVTAAMLFGCVLVLCGTALVVMRR